MRKEEANKEAKKILEECSQECERIIREAKEKGIWQRGLDANNHLFDALHKETRGKLKHLASLTDE